MLYELCEPRHFDGKSDFVNVSYLLPDLLTRDKLWVQLTFQTRSSAYGTLLSVLYKDSLLPDFGLCLDKGLLTFITRHGGRRLIYASDTAYNDGAMHTLTFQGDDTGVTIWVDGHVIIRAQELVPYCDFEYVGFVLLGRSHLNNNWGAHFEGVMHSVQIAKTKIDPPKAVARTMPEKSPLFARGVAGCENYRIPAIITTQKGTVIATADARFDAPGDNPNHIGRAVRISHDSGETWGDATIVHDPGGYGHQDGSADIDAVLFEDKTTHRIFMFYGHTPAGIGSVASKAGIGFDDTGRKQLYDKRGNLFLQEKSGEIVDANGVASGYTTSNISSVSHGKDRLFYETETTFLQYQYSDDEGETWSEPIDVNAMVKEPWMSFLGPGPGCGVQISTGAYQGRLLFPVYYRNMDTMLYSCAAIYSDDHGETWHLGDAVSEGRYVDGEKFDVRTTKNEMAITSESQIVELEHGVLKVFMRSTYAGYVATALSHDGGTTWHSFALDLALVDPNCQCSAVRVMHKGAPIWLFSNPAHQTLRAHGTVYVSTDETRTWCHKKLLEGGEYAYNSMTQLPDGQIGVLFETRDLQQMFAKFPLEWLLS